MTELVSGILILTGLVTVGLAFAIKDAGWQEVLKALIFVGLVGGLVILGLYLIVIGAEKLT